MAGRNMSDSSSSSSSATPEPVIELSKKKKPKAKKDKDKDPKGKKKESVSVSASVNEKGKNEGEDPFWRYKPPSGSVLLEGEVDAGEYSWDEINDNDNLELCLIRVPNSVKPSFLEKAEITLPSSSITTRITSLKRKHATFDIWTVGNDDNQQIGGEEIKSISCLLPRNGKKGKLYPAPKSVTHHLVVIAQAPTPTSPTAFQQEEHTRVTQNPPRHSYPRDLLKHKFMPYGSLATVPNDDSNVVDNAAPMEVDTKTTTKPPDDGRSSSKSEKKAKKKRKGDGDIEPAPSKKSKKAKT